MNKKDYDPYVELAKDIVIQMCEDYIKSSRFILKYGKRKDLTENQFNRLHAAIKHREEDILFFKSDKPETLCGYSGEFILKTLNERLLNHG